MLHLPLITCGETIKSLCVVEEGGFSVIIYRTPPSVCLCRRILLNSLHLCKSVYANVCFVCLYQYLFIHFTISTLLHLSKPLYLRPPSTVCACVCLLRVGYYRQSTAFKKGDGKEMKINI